MNFLSARDIAIRRRDAKYSIIPTTYIGVQTLRSRLCSCNDEEEKKSVPVKVDEFKEQVNTMWQDITIRQSDRNQTRYRSKGWKFINSKYQRVDARRS